MTFYEIGNQIKPIIHKILTKALLNEKSNLYL